MPAGSVAVKERHQPLVLVDTAGLSEEEWLAYRRKGIGGSDVAALLGISPWRTARDLFYDKLNIAVVEDHEDNWVALEMGHLLEPLVAKIFHHRTGYKIYQIKKMFQHPKYPWMLADVDYFVELPDGTTAILEIKTTNYNAKDNWWLDGEETIPAYYESQGRHYMAVMDVDRCFFCCLYGNNEQESIIRDMQRDLAYEDEMIFLEQNFWQNHVLTRTPPPYTEDGDLVIESVRRYTGPADKEAPAVSLDLPLTAKLMRFLQLQEQKKGAEAGKKEIEEDMKRLKAAIIVPLIGFFSGRLGLVSQFQLVRGLIQILVVLKSRLRRRLCGRRCGLTVSRRHRQLVKVLPVLKSALAGERGGRRFAAFLHIQRHFRKISHNKLLSVDKNGMDQDKTCSMPSFTCVTAHRVMC